MSSAQKLGNTGTALPELTPRVIVLGLLLSVVMGAANVYVGLKAGMTVSASIPAAVMAMMFFRLLFNNSSIREANQVQTCASAGESLAAGIIFTMPAMIMIGYWTSFDYWTVSVIAFTGGLLGILFMIPMRQVFVVNNEELAYPEGVACAAVLEAGEAKGTDADEDVNLVFGGLLGAAFKLLSDFMGLIVGTLQTAKVFGTRILYIGGDLSPMLVAVGFIVRLNVALLIFIGGALSWLIGIPIIGGAVEGQDAVEQAYDLWSKQVRYVGVGAMVLGGFASLYSVRGGLIAAVRQLWNGLSGNGKSTDETQRDIPSVVILLLGIVCVILLALVNYSFTKGAGITVLSTIVMVVLGFFFTAVASYIVGLVGNSNSPVSGMTITAVLVAGGLLYLAGFKGQEAMVATLGIAAIVCCVACTSGDVCNDLKTGSLVGASPFRQQIMQIMGVLVASLVMAPVLNLLHSNTDGGIGGPELSAPQASLFAELARGFAGETELPWNLILIGIGVGAVILFIDFILKTNDAKFRAYLMPIAVGMYLPFGLAIPILIGGILAHLYSRGKPEEEHDSILHRGVLFSSGVIAGEALTAVGIAILAAFGVSSLALEMSTTVTTLISIVCAAVAIVLFAIRCRPKKNR
ncbi:MAG: oligopeptide transporter, OPT family [Pirellulaceae bacterium]